VPPDIWLLPILWIVASGAAMYALVREGVADGKDGSRARFSLETGIPAGALFWLALRAAVSWLPRGYLGAEARLWFSMAAALLSAGLVWGISAFRLASLLGGPGWRLEETQIRIATAVGVALTVVGAVTAFTVYAPE
jgi:hypothetical protein